MAMMRNLAVIIRKDTVDQVRMSVVAKGVWPPYIPLASSGSPRVGSWGPSSGVWGEASNGEQVSR